MIGNYKKMKFSLVEEIRRRNNIILYYKDKIFNMGISQKLEFVLKKRILYLTVFAGFLAAVALFFMIQAPSYLLTSLLVGFIAMVADFIIEYKGISRNEWNYPYQHISFGDVPLEVPLLFFSCGILATFAFLHFSSQPMVTIISSPVMAGFSIVQISLFLLGAFFMFQYFRGEVKSLVFGALPIGVALYLSYSEPWVLVVSILPVYIDYYLEKRLVKTAHIKYDMYDEDIALNVAISYFSTTLFIFGCIAVILHLFT